MKHVGLNVAADPLFTLSYTGVNGGIVLCVADDPGMHSSQNEQDSRHYAIAAKVPMLEPADSQEAKEFAKAAFSLSEDYDTPVILRMCTRISHSQSMIELEERVVPPQKPYQKNVAKYVMMWRSVPKSCGSWRRTVPLTGWRWAAHSLALSPPAPAISTSRRYSAIQSAS